MPLPGESFTALPDPAQAGNLADLVDQLRRLKVWAGNPSYETIKGRVDEAWAGAGRPASELVSRSTVAYCFRPGRQRIDTDLMVAVVRALHPDTGYVTQWRQALRMIGGEVEAVSQVRVQDSLPPDLARFIGRDRELDRLRRAVQDGETVVIAAIEGMAGVGKTQLAVHAAHVLHRERPFERVLFVNLRGFDADPAQPPADPAAVLDGFLRLLGVPGQQIPHDLTGRATLYRDRLGALRALVVLDNAGSTEQVRPLLPGAPNCSTVITSRRSLTDLGPALHVTVDVFTPAEAVAFLTDAVPEHAIGPDPHAAARIAHRFGHLPLALDLVATHFRNTPGWTLTDHADRLDEHHRNRRLGDGVELALHLSYQHLPAAQRRLLRMAALHPGKDLDAYAAAALADTDLATVEGLLHDLHRDHLLQQNAPGRYTFHDLVHVYATIRGTDEDRPSERRDALTRLFDHYLALASTAMNTMYPAEARRRPAIAPAGTPAPDLTDPVSAQEWLDAQRPALVAMTAHTAAHGWPTHATRLSRTLFRYLSGGHSTDALTVHRHAHHAARLTGDLMAQAEALTDLGGAHFGLGRFDPADEHFRQALDLFRQVGDRYGEARAMGNLGVIAERAGDHRMAADYYGQALVLYRQAGDQTGEARSLSNLGYLEARTGHHDLAIGHHEQALALQYQAGDLAGGAGTLLNLGEAEMRTSRYESARDHLEQALALFRRFGDPVGEAYSLIALGILHTGLGRPAPATDHYRQAMVIFRETDNRDGEAWALNGLGGAAHADGRSADALTHHAAALAITTDTGDRDQEARAHAGLGHAQQALGNVDLARDHYESALVIYSDLGLPEAGEIRSRIGALGARGVSPSSSP